jgi:galactose mutarotase-like enzyme
MIPGDTPSTVMSWKSNNLSQHGFARTALWSFDETRSVVDGEKTSAVFSFSDNTETSQVWPQRFILTYTVTLTEK